MRIQARHVVDGNTKANNFTGTVFNEPKKVIGIGHGFGTSRPASRDSRMRTQANTRHPIQKTNQALNQTQGAAQKQQVNNFFS